MNIARHIEALATARGAQAGIVDPAMAALTFAHAARVWFPHSDKRTLGASVAELYRLSDGSFLLIGAPRVACIGSLPAGPTMDQAEEVFTRALLDTLIVRALADDACEVPSAARTVPTGVVPRDLDAPCQCPVCKAERGDA